MDKSDQLANDLSQGEGRHQNLEKGGEGSDGDSSVAGPTREGLSKLSISDGDPGPTILQEAGIRDDEIWMQEKGPDRRIFENPSVSLILGLIEATQDMSEADAVTHLHTVIGALVGIPLTDLSDSNFGTKADVGATFDTPSEEDDLQDHAWPQDFVPDTTLCDGGTPISHHTFGNADAAEPTTISLQSLRWDLLPPDPSQSCFGELQWSEFFANEEGPSGLNEFFSEWDDETGAFFDQGLHDTQVGSPVAAPLSKWEVETESLADQIILAAPGGLGDDIAGTQLQGGGDDGLQNQLETHQSQGGS